MQDSQGPAASPLRRHSGAFRRTQRYRAKSAKPRHAVAASCRPGSGALLSNLSRVSGRHSPTSGKAPFRMFTSQKLPIGAGPRGGTWAHVARTKRSRPFEANACGEQCVSRRSQRRRDAARSASAAPGRLSSSVVEWAVSFCLGCSVDIGRDTEAPLACGIPTDRHDCCIGAQRARRSCTRKTA
jgi:hypothetical protein